jgi:hypothetical protein
VRRKTFEDMDAYERWQTWRGRVNACFGIALGVLFMVIHEPPLGFSALDIVALIASGVAGWVVGTRSSWYERAWRRNAIWGLVLVVSGVVLWLIVRGLGSSMSVWSVLWAGLTGAGIKELFDAHSYGRWRRERYEADLREISEL